MARPRRSRRTTTSGSTVTSLATEFTPYKSTVAQARGRPARPSRSSSAASAAWSSTARSARSPLTRGQGVPDLPGAHRDRRRRRRDVERRWSCKVHPLCRTGARCSSAAPPARPSWPCRRRCASRPTARSGPLTEAAVKAVQLNAKLTQTGVVGTAHLEGRRGADAALTRSRAPWAECGRALPGSRLRTHGQVSGSARGGDALGGQPRAEHGRARARPGSATSEPSPAQTARASRRNAAVSVVAVCTRSGPCRRPVAAPGPRSRRRRRAPAAPGRRRPARPRRRRRHRASRARGPRRPRPEAPCRRAERASAASVTSTASASPAAAGRPTASVTTTSADGIAVARGLRRAGARRAARHPAWRTAAVRGHLDARADRPRRERPVEGAPVRRQVEHARPSRADVEVVPQEVGGLGHPVGEHPGGQLDALAAGGGVGVVVDGDARAAGVGGHQRAQEGGRVGLTVATLVRVPDGGPGGH